MIDVKENYPLAPLTTIKIGGPAKYFVRISDLAELDAALSFADQKDVDVLPFGGGSNVLFSDAGFNGLVLEVGNKGIEAEEHDGFVRLRVASGELWDDVVAFAAKNNWWGIENLSHIPGNAGGFAVQNVGAYGQEAGQVVEAVEAYDLHTDQLVTLANEQCGFEYRKSIFNTVERGRYIILHTTLRLSKTPRPNLEYPDLKKRFEGKQPGISEIRKAMEEIRDKKFPYPYYPGAKGSAGSFFKNSVLSAQQYESLEKKVAENIPEALEKLRQIKNKFPQDKGIKIPTAFIFQICGIKGMAVGGAKINETQPLVVLNDTGSATAAEVLELVSQVKNIVKTKTGLDVQIEPELIGFG